MDADLLQGKESCVSCVQRNPDINRNRDDVDCMIWLLYVFIMLKL